MHQCLKCKKLYEDDVVPILEGCGCGSRMFLFVRNPEDIKRAEEIYNELEQKIEEIDRERSSQLDEIKVDAESKYKKKVKIKEKAFQEAKPEQKIFGIETIRVQDIGVYEINLEALMKGKPIIVLSKSGSYIISLPTVFDKKSETELKLT